MVNATTFFLSHLRTVSRASSGTIVVGGLVTYLVIALDLEAELEPLPTLLGSSALDIIVCHSQYIVREKSPDKYTLMIAHREIAIIIMSGPRRIDVHDNRNRIFDVEDIEDKDANQLTYS
ncbi:hypothetical protein KIW84_057657 [Lathyrus oleraceus]|uniref:Uncharacterized protein n=1 Tax=Pisum sativum TaxID=3888 RepID=A0A9D4X1Q9_PEA|nr:hypothetical protein KIW84_057657 [Pisum sativum]